MDEKNLERIARLTGAGNGPGLAKRLLEEASKKNPDWKEDPSTLTREDEEDLAYCAAVFALRDPGSGEAAKAEARAEFPRLVASVVRRAIIRAEVLDREWDALGAEMAPFRTDGLGSVMEDLAFDLDAVEAEAPATPDGSLERFLKEAFAAAGREWDLREHRRRQILRYEDAKLLDERGTCDRSYYDAVRAEYDRGRTDVRADAAETPSKALERRAKAFRSALEEKALDPEKADDVGAIAVRDALRWAKEEEAANGHSDHSRPAKAAKFWLMADVLAGTRKASEYPGDLATDLTELDECAAYAEIAGHERAERELKALADIGVEPTDAGTWRNALAFRKAARRAILNAMTRAERAGIQAFTERSARTMDAYCPFHGTQWPYRFGKEPLDGPWYDPYRYGADGVLGQLRRQADACEAAGYGGDAMVLRRAIARVEGSARGGR